MPATLEIAADVLPPETRGPGRPPAYNDQRAAAVCAVIRSKGFALSRAAILVGLSASTVCEWNREIPEFAQAAARAEAEWLGDRVDEMVSARTKWGSIDPKAMELLLRRFPEFQQTQRTEIDQRSLNISVTLTGDQLAKLQSQWQQALEDGK